MLCPECRRENTDEARFCSECGHRLYLSLLTGTLLNNDRYEVKSPIKPGAMGAIYEVWDYREEKSCALKAMFPSFTDREELKKAEERFENEAKLLSDLNHPGLPRVTDYFSGEGIYYLVMDLIVGSDFEEIIEEEGKPGLPENVVRNTSIEILEILQYLHSQDPPILYRDLKPSNIMRRDSDGKIILVDFGIAKAAKRSPAATGTKLGTEGYAPVEQYRGKAEPRSDLYSLGATMHHMLTGIPPIAFSFDSLKQITPAVSSSIIAIVGRALEVDPRDRFSSAEEMKEALKGNIKLINILDKKPRKRAVGTQPVQNRSTSVPPQVPAKQASSRPIPVQKPVKLTTDKANVRPKGLEDLTIFFFIMSPVIFIALILMYLFFSPGFYYSRHFKSGVESYNSKKYRQAIKSFNAALKHDPGKADIYLYLGRAYLADNNYREAIMNLNKAVRKDDSLKKKVRKDLALAYYKKGGSLAENGNINDAAADFRVAFELNPALKESSDPDILYYRGLINHGNKEYDRAIELFSSSMKKSRNLPVILARAESYLAKGDLINAKSDLDRAMSMDPKGAEKRVNEITGRILDMVKKEALAKMNDQKYSDVINYLNDIQDIFGKNPELQKLQAEAYTRNGIDYYTFYEYDKSLAFLEKALKLNPDSAEAWYYKGEVLYRLKEYEKALPAYKRAVELDPGKYGGKAAYKITSINRYISRGSSYTTRYTTLSSPVKVSRKGLQEFVYLAGSRSMGYLVKDKSNNLYLLTYIGSYLYMRTNSTYMGKLSDSGMILYIPDSRGNEKAYDFPVKKPEKIKVAMVSKGSTKVKIGSTRVSSGYHTITLQNENGSTFFIDGNSGSDELKQGEIYYGIVYPSRVDFFMGDNYLKRSYNIKGFGKLSR